MKIQSSFRTIVVALMLSLGLAATSYAMPRDEHHGPGMGRPGHPAMMMHGRAMNRLHDELKLDAKQDVAWKEAEKFSQEHRDTMRERSRKHHDEIKALLDQPGADLRTVAKRMDELKADGQKQSLEVRERWLDVYDTLNPEQKEKARLFFKSGFEKMGRMSQPSGHHGRSQSPRGKPAAEQAAPVR